MLRCAEAEGTELTGGPGWQRRGGGNARLRAGAGWWGRAVRRCGATWALGELACAGWAVRSGAKRETKRAVLSETGRGGAGPVSRALAARLGRANWAAGSWVGLRGFFGFSGFWAFFLISIFLLSKSNSNKV